MARIWMAGLLLACALDASAQSGPSVARELLDRASVAWKAQDSAEGYRLVQQAIIEPGFDALAADAQHAALNMAYGYAYAAKDYTQAHAYALRASAMPQQTLQDWQYRLSSAMQLKDPRDEARSIAGLVRVQGSDLATLKIETVAAVYRNTRPAEFAAPRQDMLLALYDHRWRPEPPATASFLWRALAQSLVDSNDLSRAALVTTQVDDPSDLIALHADRRYERLLSAHNVQSDPHRAADAKIRYLRAQSAERPRSLSVLLRLLDFLLECRGDREVIDLATQADQRIIKAAADSPPFDDTDKQYAWLLDTKARALGHLGDFDGDLAERRRALHVRHSSDMVSHAINLGSVLCDLGMPDEAVAVLPRMEDASDYGKAQVVLVGLKAAVVRGDAATAHELLGFLEARREASPASYQEGLLMAGETGKAEEVLLSRLAAPDLRIDALLELQNYADYKRPPRAQEWHRAFEQLKASSAVQKAVAQVGNIGSYTWRY